MKLKKCALLALIGILLCAFALTGCDALGGNNNTISTIMIQSVEIVGDHAKITYEDGYVLELNDVSKSPLLYYREVYVPFEEFTAELMTDKAETDGAVTETVTETMTENPVDETETADTATETQYETSQSKETESQEKPFGVRVMGTLENPMAISVTVQGGSAIQGGNVAVQGQGGSYVVQGGGSAVEGGNFVIQGGSAAVIQGSFATGMLVSEVIEIDGKRYEAYYARLKEHIAANCKEIVVDETVGDDTVTAVMKGGFSQLTALEKVTLPASITEIGKAAFYQCTSLTDITFLGTVEQWNAIAKSADWDKNSGNYTVHCTDGDIAKETTAKTGEK